MAKDSINEKYKDAVGLKFDGGKLRWDLMPFRELEQICSRFTRGAEKYSPDNWKLVDDPENRYFAAAMRHLSEYKKGNILDDDPGFEGKPGQPHLAAAAWNILCLMWFENEKALKNNESKRVAKNKSR